MENLDGRSFTASNLNGPGFAGISAELKFIDGRVAGYTGCNRFSSPYSIDGSTLVAGPFMSTMMACVGGSMEAETWIQQQLSEKPSLTIDGSELVITPNASNSQAIRFRENDL
jgi:heat shock protein HslJ